MWVSDMEMVQERLAFKWVLNASHIHSLESNPCCRLMVKMEIYIPSVAEIQIIICGSIGAVHRKVIN